MTDYKPFYNETDPPPAYGTGPPHPQYPPAQGTAPPQPAVYVPQPATTTVVVTTLLTEFRDTSVQLRCPNCHQDVFTTITYESGLLTLLAVVILFIIGGIFCFWIPLLIDGLKDVHHTCPSCHYRCGTYKRLG